MASIQNLSVVIDVGTSKLAGLAGRKTNDGKMEIMAHGVVPSKGLKRGLVFNIDEVATSVNRLLKLLESQMEYQITSVNISYAGQHMKTVNYQGYRFTSDEGIVSDFDINELFYEAKNYKVEQDYKILHIIPQSFVVDDEVTGPNPVGITGRKIEANYKLVIVPEIQLFNFQRVFERTSAELDEVVLSPFATSEAVLTDDEKEDGAIALDIGAGTTKLCVYYDNVLLHTAVIPFGGNVVTKDIKEGCSILIKWAELLKVKYGQALGDQANEQEVVTIPGYNGWEPKEISFRSLAFIIQARIEEIVDSVYHHIGKTEIAGQLGAGIVITGGTSLLNNLVPLVKFRTGMDARLAFPVIHPINLKKELQNQEFFTALGLLKLGLENAEEPVKKRGRKKDRKKKDGGGISLSFNKIVQGMLDLVDDDNEDLPMNN